LFENKLALNTNYRKYQEETTNLDANKLASEDKSPVETKTNKMNFSWIYHKNYTEGKEKPAGIVLE